MADRSTELLACQRSLFRLPDGVAYLSCASRSPLPVHIEAIGHAAVSKKIEPWKISDDGVHERVRGLFAQLVGAASADAVALTPSTSYAISMVAHNIQRLGLLGRGDAVLVIEDQMSSNVYPWQRLCREVGARLVPIATPQDHRWTEALEARAAELAAEGLRLGVVAVPHFRWTDGSGPLDLGRLAKLCRQFDGRRAVLVVDATQSLGAVPLDAPACGVDWLACSVHKWLFAPYGLSCLYVAEEWRGDPRTEPLVHDEHNRLGADGDTCLPFELERPGYAEEFMAGARRFDAGGRANPILMPMVEAALQLILDWQPARIGAYCSKLVDEIAAGAASLALSVPARHAPHFVGVGPGPSDLVGVTAANLVAARVAWADDAAAHLKKRGVLVSSRSGVLRVAPNVYNTSNEVAKFVTALGEFVRSRRQGVAAL